MEWREFFKRYAQLGAMDQRYNFLCNLGAALLLLIAVPVLFSLQQLNEQEAAVPLEMGISLLGIILIAPAFIPEEEEGIQDTILARYTGYGCLCTIRIVWCAVVSAILTVLFFVAMWAGSCSISLYTYAGTLANILFLGGMGLLAHAVVNQALAAYTVPLLYYALNIGGFGKQLGPFYLFSMMTDSESGKLPLLIAGLVFLMVAVMIRCRRLKNGD